MVRDNTGKGSADSWTEGLETYAEVFRLYPVERWQYWHFFFFKLIYLFLAALGLCFCAWAFSSCGEQGLLFIVVRGLLIAVASLVEHGL